VTVVHATSVRHAGKAVLLMGSSGSGKSTLALQMLGLGAELVADDRTILDSAPEGLIASCPATTSGLIEARGVGIINTPPAEPSVVSLAVDMDRIAQDRMPSQDNVTLCGHILPLLWKVELPHFPATLLHILEHGRSAR